MVTAGFASCQVRFTRHEFATCLQLLLSVTMVASRLFGGYFVGGEMKLVATSPDAGQFNFKLLS